MKRKAERVILLILVGFLGGQARADGRFFVREKIPVNVPYQRAFLLFDEGTETLVVQSKYELPQSGEVDSLAWLVPVPNVPELASADAEATRHFFRTVSYLTQPSNRRLSNVLSYVTAVVFLAGVVLLLLCLVQYPLIGKRLSRKIWERRGRAAVLTTLFGFLGVLSTMPHLGRASSGSVEIVKTKQVGIYDVTVIRGDSADAVQEWLRENGFAFDDQDKAVFADYVARGWCFVTAKVSPEAELQENQVAAEGLAAPLVLTFATESPVYPLALTATAGPETTILIYTLTAKKLTCGERLKLRHARETHASSVTRGLYISTGAGTDGPMEGLPDKPMMLCKFKGTMTAAQMAEDLVFETAPDNVPYQETKWLWRRGSQLALEGGEGRPRFARDRSPAQAGRPKRACGAIL